MKNKQLSIIDEYADLAESMGIFSKTADAYDDQIKRPTKEEISNIEILYGIKPNGKDYDRNIVEKAHPETMVVAPAYDAMNSIVENVNQRQDIISDIARKMPSGNFINFKYVSAHDDLQKAIVRAAFKLDSDDETELMVFADNLSTRLEKEAFIQFLANPWVLGGLATLFGSISFINHTADSRQNVIANGERCLSELRDLQGKMPVDNIISSVTTLITAAQSFESIKLNAFTPQDIMAAGKENKETIKAAHDYLNKLNVMSTLIPKYITQLETLQSNESAEWDWLQKVKDITRTFIPDDATDAVNALRGLQKSIIADIKAANLVMQQSDELMPDLNAILAKQQHQAATTETPAQLKAVEEHSEPSETDSSTNEEMEQMYADLMKQLS